MGKVLEIWNHARAGGVNVKHNSKAYPLKQRVKLIYAPEIPRVRYVVIEGNICINTGYDEQTYPINKNRFFIMRDTSAPSIQLELLDGGLS